MTTPTAEVIQEQLLWLKNNRDKICHYSFFGEDNRAKVDAQIQVIENDLEEDEICELDLTEGERDAALEVRYWMDGDDDCTPEENWKGLVQP